MNINAIKTNGFRFILITIMGFFIPLSAMANNGPVITFVDTDVLKVLPDQLAINLLKLNFNFTYTYKVDGGYFTDNKTISVGSDGRTTFDLSDKPTFTMNHALFADGQSMDEKGRTLYFETSNDSSCWNFENVFSQYPDSKHFEILISAIPDNLPSAMRYKLHCRINPSN
jgi:hypothetical protein